jgi:pimeloyl-ACP methyl ester carboxylesterase
LPNLGTANVARDIDAVRKAMEFDEISYLGYSYGTFVGAMYADMFGEQTDRIVLDSAMDPALDYQQIRHGQAQGMQRSLTKFVEDCLAQQKCPLTGPRDTALQQISDLIEGLNDKPYVDAAGKRLSGARMLALVESSQYFPESGWPSLRESLSQALAGDWAPVLEAAYSPDLMVNPADSEYLSVACLDFQTERDPEIPQRLAPVWANENPITGGNRAWSLAPCETWPVPADRDPQPIRAAAAGPILILNTAGDPATPLAWAQSLHDQLDNSTLVVAPEEGHIASTQNSCAEDTLTEFLRNGTLPADPIFTCPANP